MARFDERFFFFVLLPPIIFEAGYNMQRRKFFQNIGAICVYIGADFLWDNLVEPFTSALPTIKSATFDIGALLQGIGNALMSVIGSWAVLLICVKKDMLLGTVLGVAGFQIAAFFKKRKGTSGLEGA